MGLKREGHKRLPTQPQVARRTVLVVVAAVSVVR
jgi:hypothetical protein